MQRAAMQEQCTPPASLLKWHRVFTEKGPVFVTVDPLHAMNYAWEHVFASFVTRCLQLSGLNRREDVELNPQTPLAKLRY